MFKKLLFLTATLMPSACMLGSQAERDATQFAKEQETKQASAQQHVDKNQPWQLIKTIEDFKAPLVLKTFSIKKNNFLVTGDDAGIISIFEPRTWTCIASYQFTDAIYDVDIRTSATEKTTYIAVSFKKEKEIFVGILDLEHKQIIRLGRMYCANIHQCMNLTFCDEDNTSGSVVLKAHSQKSDGVKFFFKHLAQAIYPDSKFINPVYPGFAQPFKRDRIEKKQSLAHCDATNTFYMREKGGKVFYTQPAKKTDKPLRFIGHQESVSKVLCLHTQQHQEHLISADHTGYIKMWNPTNAQCEHSWQAHDAAITDLETISIDQTVNYIITAGRDNRIKIWGQQTEIPEPKKETKVCNFCKKSAAHTLKLFLCSRCSADTTENPTRYCSSKCQHNDWPEHKKTCKKTKADEGDTKKRAAKPEPEHQSAAPTSGSGHDTDLQTSHYRDPKEALSDLTLAASENDTDTVKTMINLGVDVNICDDHIHQTPLMVAALFGNNEVVQLLIEHGADVNKASIFGATALTNAWTDQAIVEAFRAQKNLKTRHTIPWSIDRNEKLIELLLQHKANPNTITGAHSALDLAILNNNIRAVKLLLKHGAVLNPDDIDGPKYKSAPEEIRTFLKIFNNHQKLKNASNSTSTSGPGPSGASGISTAPAKKVAVPDEIEVDKLFSAIRDNNIETVKEMIGLGVDVNIERANVTPLIAAASFGHMKIAQLLIAHGADVNKRAIDGFSALLSASCANQADMVKFLFEHGAKIDEKDAQAINDESISPVTRRLFKFHIFLHKSTKKSESASTSGPGPSGASSAASASASIAHPFDAKRCEYCLIDEQRLGKKLVACKFCPDILYCTKECQVDHWKQHKAVCKKPKKKVIDEIPEEVD